MSTTKFEPTMYVAAYRLAADGFSDEKIADSLGVAGITLRAWCRNLPALAKAIADGREVHGARGSEVTFGEYVYGYLPPELRDVWDQINEWTNLRNGRARIEALLVRHGKHARQSLFVHALTESMFNVSQSLRKLNISRKTFENWMATDPNFHALIDEIEWHKDNYFEGKFMRLVRGGSEAAILHAAKTRLRKRGYNERIEVEHTGTVGVEATVSLADLELPLDVRRQVLEALRRRNGSVAELTAAGEQN